MQTITGIIIAIIFVALFFGAIKWRRHVVEQELSRFQEKDNSYTLVIDSYDWGPEVKALILNIGNSSKDFTDQDFYPENFSTELSYFYEKDGQEIEESVSRPVNSISWCDIDGNEMNPDEGADHLLLEFNVDGYSKDYSPFYQDKDYNYFWKETYTYSIKNSKFTANIINTNDPLFTPEAKDQCSKLGLKLN